MNVFLAKKRCYSRCVRDVEPYGRRPTQLVCFVCNHRLAGAGYNQPEFEGL